MLDVLESAKRLSLLKLRQTIPEYRRGLFGDIVGATARITGIYGSRGVGKTTLLVQLLKASAVDADKKLYISCDHPIFKGVSLFDFVDEFSKRGGELIAIDEIHESVDFESQLKSIYDFLDIKVLFSGSSAVRITSPDFARRFSMHHLPILSFREYLEIAEGLKLESFTLEEILSHHENITHGILASLGNKKILALYDGFVREGCYPFYFEDKTKYIDRIGETINTILHTDLGRIFSVAPDKIDTLKKLLLTICVSKPLELSIDRLASTVGITKTTLYKYIDYLGRAELVRHISHEAKRFAAMRRPDKLYLANTNLFSALCMESEKGTIRETWFASMVGSSHALHYPERGDFLVDEKWLFEIGGKTKGFTQIRDAADAFVVADDTEIGTGRKIPLWLFGFLK